MQASLNLICFNPILQRDRVAISRHSHLQTSSGRYGIALTMAVTTTVGKDWNDLPSQSWHPFEVGAGFEAPDSGGCCARLLRHLVVDTRGTPLRTAITRAVWGLPQYRPTSCWRLGQMRARLEPQDASVEFGLWFRWFWVLILNSPVLGVVGILEIENPPSEAGIQQLLFNNCCMCFY